MKNEVGDIREEPGNREEPGQSGYERSVRERHGERVRDRKRKSDILLQTLLDTGRGVLIVGFGVFFLIAPRLGYDFAVDNPIRYGFSGLCLLYGGWRIYRGYKKNYD
jgi:hypothetical protein